MITTRVFGKTSRGEAVRLYKLENSRGEYAELCDLGAVIHSIVTRDRWGRLGDNVLGCPDVEHMEGKSFKGATIGRCANRIAFGRCRLHGQEVQLEVNEAPNILHSASGNYAFKLFSASIDPIKNSVTFSYKDPGPEGYHDNVDVKVTFTFDDTSALTIHYELTPERETVLCPTNHAYFNLSGFGDARDMWLQLLSTNRAHRGAGNVPDGGLDPVAGTAYDFFIPRTLRSAMGDTVKGYDDFYVVDRIRKDNLIAELYSPATGKVMHTYTDMQGAILYTPTNCDTRPDKSGITLPPYGAVCIECQFVPNAVNCPEFDSPVFGPGQKLVTETVYKFGVR